MAKLARKRFQIWNGSRDWLILGKECCSDVSSHFLRGEHCVTSQKTAAKETTVSAVCCILLFNKL